MKKIIVPGLTAGVILFLLSIFGLYATIWFFPGIAVQYFDPAFNDQGNRYLLYYVHPFIIALALSWFWSRFKSVLTGSFIARGIEFGLIYVVMATLPAIWMIYSAVSVSLAMAATWFVFGLLQGVIAGLVFEKMNP